MTAHLTHSPSRTGPAQQQQAALPDTGISAVLRQGQTVQTAVSTGAAGVSCGGSARESSSSFNTSINGVIAALQRAGATSLVERVLKHRRHNNC